MKVGVLSWWSGASPGWLRCVCQNSFSRGNSLAVQWLRLVCALPVQGARVRSLFRELRSHMPCGQTTTTKQKPLYFPSLPNSLAELNFLLVFKYVVSCLSCLLPLCSSLSLEFPPFLNGSHGSRPISSEYLCHEIFSDFSQL